MLILKESTYATHFVTHFSQSAVNAYKGQKACMPLVHRDICYYKNGEFNLLAITKINLSDTELKIVQVMIFLCLSSECITGWRTITKICSIFICNSHTFVKKNITCPFFF
jgi:hypothetical protein